MEENKKGWKKNYTAVLVLNSVYVVVFYLLMRYSS